MSTKTRFEKEAKGNSEMVYLQPTKRVPYPFLPVSPDPEGFGLHTNVQEHEKLYAWESACFQYLEKRLPNDFAETNGEVI